MVVGKDGVPVVIRFPKKLLEGLTAAAKREGRSRNSEIVVRLHESIRPAARSNKKTAQSK